MTLQTDPDATAPDHTAPAGRWARLRPLVERQLWLFLELFALTGLVVAQPLLDVLGRAPDFLLFRQADGRDIVALAIAITHAHSRSWRRFEALAAGERARP